jgi:hypothetical protein
MNTVPGSLLADKDDWEFIKHNKPTPSNTISLEINLWLGYMYNGDTWVSQDQYDSAPGTELIPWHSVSVSLVIDQQLVYQGTPIEQRLIQYQMPDSGEHSIEIAINGLNDRHRPVWPKDRSYGSVMLQITGTFEHMPLNLLMSSFGSYHTNDGQNNVATQIMGQNGIQRWNFTSPFYHWIHQRRNVIIGQLTYPCS